MGALTRMTTWLEFLASLHAELKPRCYLEVGVHGVFNGASFRLADENTLAIGIDPAPSGFVPPRNHQLYQMTSDDYFQYMADETLHIDFAFIDGSHLFEDALRDFINIEMHSNQNTVVVFDDMLPMTQEMSSRYMVPGYWTGDVWKVYQILTESRPGLHCVLVDTEPTGTMLVYGLNPRNQTLMMHYGQLVDKFSIMERVPDGLLFRTSSVNPEFAINKLNAWLKENGNG